MLKGIFTAFGTLLVVVAILYLAFICTKHVGKGMQTRSRSRYMKMVDQLVLGTDRSLAIVDVGGKLFLIGIAPNQITTLSELQEDELIPLTQSQDTNAQAPDFKELMNKIGKRYRKK